MGTEVIAARSMNTLYIWLDVAFLISFLIVLIWTKRYQALLAGLAGGIIYFLVDYGIFYLALKTRVVTGADTALFLLWLSMSYGFTNFAWIWLWLDRDGHALEWSLFIMSGWLCVGLLSQSFGAGFALISISRGTSGYHGIMALLLFIGYAALVIHNIRKPDQRIAIGWILAIGILVQGSWEFVLAITGIRNLSLQTFIVNTLLETNMGLPYLWMIHRAIGRCRNEDLSRAGTPAVQAAVP
ncbi:MAG: hypothetical protein SCM11_01365 [Bacillota bacterium]|nr:hypothetical protein [Bacillota bacterium]